MKHFTDSDAADNAFQWGHGNNACILQNVPETEGKYEPDLVREKRHILNSLLTQSIQINTVAGC